MPADRHRAGPGAVFLGRKTTGPQGSLNITLTSKSSEVGYRCVLHVLPEAVALVGSEYTSVVLTPLEHC